MLQDLGWLKKVQLQNVAGTDINPATNEKMEELKTLLTSIYGAVDELEIKSDNIHLEASQINLNTDELEAKTQSIRDQLDVLSSSRASEVTVQEILDSLGSESGTNLLTELQNINTALGSGDLATESTLIEIRDSLDTVEAKLQLLIDNLDVPLSTRASETTSQAIKATIGEESGATVLSKLGDLESSINSQLPLSVDNYVKVQQFGSVLVDENFINNSFDTINKWVETITGNASRVVQDSVLSLSVNTGNTDAISEKISYSLTGTSGAIITFCTAITLPAIIENNVVLEWGTKDLININGLFFRATNNHLYIVELKAGIETVIDVSGFRPIDEIPHIYTFEQFSNLQYFATFDQIQTLHNNVTTVPYMADKEFIPYFAVYNAGVTTTSVTLEICGMHLIDKAGFKTTIQGIDDVGVVRDVAVSPTRRLLTSAEPPVPPPDTTGVTFTEYGNVAGEDDYDYLIPNGETLVVQRFSAGAEPAGGSNVELWYDPDGTKLNMNIIDVIFSDGQSDQHDLNDSFLGDGTNRVIMRRTGLGSANARVIFGRWEGYY